MYFNSNIVASKSPFGNVLSLSTENLRLLENFNQLNDQRTNIKKRLSVIIILIVNALERFAYYGLLCNFILYLNKQPLYWRSLDANLIAFIFIGITYFTSLIGGWLSDSVFGKFSVNDKTSIGLSSFRYFIYRKVQHNLFKLYHLFNWLHFVSNSICE